MLGRIKQIVRQKSVPVRTFLAKRSIFLSKNDRSLWAMKDRHKGEEAVIIAMGPSLRTGDLDLFKGKVTFGCNKIYLAYEETSFRPDYYSVIDVVVAQNNREEIAKVSGSEKIFPLYLKKELLPMSDAVFFHAWEDFHDKTEAFLRSNPLEGVLAGGATVIVSQLQLAYWMGCKTIYIVGLDFSFKVPEEVTGQSKQGEELLTNADEVNHFHKDYRKPGETWTMPRMDEQERGFAYARAAYETDGRKVINASRQSKLELLERAEFDSVFSNSES